MPIDELGNFISRHKGFIGIRVRLMCWLLGLVAQAMFPARIPLRGADVLLAGGRLLMMRDRAGEVLGRGL